MRRKRRNNGTWFPVLAYYIGSDGELPVAYDERELEVPFDPSYQCQAISIIPDQTVDTDARETIDYTLRDAVEGNSYILHRIVGKIAWSVAQFNPPSVDDTTWQQVICCTAFAVLPVSNDENNQGVPDLPESEYDPLRPSNLDKPYIWRRTWVLGNNAAVASPDFQHRQYQAPANNGFFSSIQDGPHIDTKSKRRIGRNERLFMIHSVLPAYPVVGVMDYSAFSVVQADLRVHGSLVKQKNTSVFT